MATSKRSVLVLLATGKLGGGIVNAFLADNTFHVYGTSRDPEHPSLVAKGVTPVAFSYGSEESIRQALEVAKPDVVVVITHMSISKSRQKEVEHGKLILDACKKYPEIHVILASTELADVAPEQGGNLKSKQDLETYIKTLGLRRYSILRSSSFFENFDDPSVHNPLVFGYLKELYEGWVEVNHVATVDVGKAAVTMSHHPEKWNSRVLSCISTRDTGNDLVQTLSKVAGVPCTYQATPPHFVLRWILTDLYYMVQHCAETTGKADWSKEMQEFRTVVPDAMDFETWLQQKQTWSDGTPFGSVPSKQKAFPVVAGVVSLAVAFLAYSMATRSS